MTVSEIVDALVGEGGVMRLPKGMSYDDADAAVQGLMPGGMVMGRAARAAKSLIPRFTAKAAKAARAAWRVDPKPVTKFTPRRFHGNKDWTQSASEPFQGATQSRKAVYAHGSEAEASLYFGPRDAPVARITKPDGSTHTMFQQSDRAAVAANRPTISELPRRSFEKLGKSGELISGKSVKPRSQRTITDPIGDMKKHGTVGFVKDLGATVKNLRKRGYSVSGENLPENMNIPEIVDVLVDDKALDYGKLPHPQHNLRLSYVHSRL